MNKNLLIAVAASAVVFTSCKEDDPTADFSASTTTPMVGDVVTFTDESSNAYNHVWDFGDGEWSTAISPTHVYGDEGTYAVTLQVTNKEGDVIAISSATSITATWPAYDGLIVAAQEVREAKAVEMAGEWRLSTSSISEPGQPSVVNTFTDFTSEFMVDGNIFTTLENGDKSLGSWYVINEEYISLSFAEGAGIYRITQLDDSNLWLDKKVTSGNETITYGLRFIR